MASEMPVRADGCPHTIAQVKKYCTTCLQEQLTSARAEREKYEGALEDILRKKQTCYIFGSTKTPHIKDQFDSCARIYTEKQTRSWCPVCRARAALAPRDTEEGRDRG